MGKQKISQLKVKTGENSFDELIILNTQDFQLKASNWIGSEAPYTQTVSIAGVTANTEGVVGISQDANESIYKEAIRAQIRCTNQNNGTITMTCYGTKPTHDLPYHITGMYESQL